MSFPLDSFVCRPHVNINPDFILIFFGTTTIGDTHGVGYVVTVNQQSYFVLGSQAK